MIRRDSADFYLIIDQHDHALLAGELGRHVGNSLFTPPAPFESVIVAISQHDVGWKAADQRPRLNSQGQPRHIFEIGVETGIAAWSESVRQAEALGTYTALLVSLHAMALASLASAHQSASQHESSRMDTFRLNQFLHRQIDLQESLRKKLAMRIDLPIRFGLSVPGRSDDEDLLLANFHLLQLLDQLSLNLCFDRVVFAKIQPVFPRCSASAITITVHRHPTGQLRLDPWPFDPDHLDLKIPARRIERRPYRDEQDIASTLAAAAREDIRVSLGRL